MLLVLCNLTRACAKGDNLAEVTEVAKHPVPLSNGQVEMRPVFGSVYLNGLPLGDGPNPIEAPIELQAADVVRVWNNFPEFVLYDVTRKGKQVWLNDALATEQDARASERDKLRKAREALQ